MDKVAIIMGSDSDLKIMGKAFTIFDEFHIYYEVRILSAHRTPEKVAEFSKNAASEGFGVIIAGAGKAAHLAGAIAANTLLPVIGVPIKSSSFGGLDALLSTVEMPNGVPVATVAVDGSYNAALLAMQILALNNASLTAKLKEFKENIKKMALEKDKNISNLYKK